MEAIYERPQDYDLEHEGDDEDIRFYTELVTRLRPRRVLELASGSGRVTCRGGLKMSSIAQRLRAQRPNAWAARRR